MFAPMKKNRPRLSYCEAPTLVPLNVSGSAGGWRSNRLTTPARNETSSLKVEPLPRDDDGE